MQNNKNTIHPQADKKLKLYLFLNLSKNISKSYKKNERKNNDYIELNNFNQYCGYHILCSE